MSKAVEFAKDAIKKYRAKTRPYSLRLDGLGLIDSDLASIASSIAGLDGLRRLYLGAASNRPNFIENIPDEIFEAHPQLEKLDISSNRICEVPSLLYKCSQLTELNLSRNRLNSLPDNFCDLVNLQTVLLSGNKLTALPKKNRQPCEMPNS